MIISGLHGELWGVLIALSFFHFCLYCISFQTIILPHMLIFCCLASACISFRKSKSSSFTKLSLFPLSIRPVVHQSSCLGFVLVFRSYSRQSQKLCQQRVFCDYGAVGDDGAAGTSRAQRRSLQVTKESLNMPRTPSVISYITSFIILTLILSIPEFVTISNTLFSRIDNLELLLI